VDGLIQRLVRQAIRLAKKFDQKAIYDSRLGQVIETGGTDQIRFTKGAQTLGGSRIGGISKGNSKRLAPISNTIKQRLQAAPKGSPIVNRDGSKRGALKALSRNIDLPEVLTVSVSLHLPIELRLFKELIAVLGLCTTTEISAMKP
jgi:hypothetical protein